MSELQPHADPTVAGRTGVVADIGQGRLMGVGSLPHVDADAAAAFSIGEYDIATVPSLPRRSSAEGLVEQATSSIRGTSVAVDLEGDAFGGLRAFLDLAAAIGHDGKPVKWQFVGPVTLGVVLHRGGLPVRQAFELAAAAVRENVSQIGALVGDVLPLSQQVVVLDEPVMSDLMTPEFPIAPDEADDVLSSAMAAAGDAIVGVHCCGPCDIAMLLASGPQLISVPVHDQLLDYAGYLARFLDDGGLVAWGVVPVDRPVGPSSDRYWRALADLWCALVERGVDATRLRRQALITPSCGLSEHQVSVARRLSRLSGEVARKVKDQAAATRFALGA